MEYIVKEDRILLYDQDKAIGEVLFPIYKKGIRILNRTYIDPSYRSGGLASNLVLQAYNYLKENNLKAVATCPYIVKWFQRNPDKQDILVLGEQEKLGEACALA